MAEEPDLEQLLEVCDFCGCGLPELAIAYVGEGLRKIQDNTARDREPDGADYLFWYWAESRGLTGHGVSVPGWLTPLGVETLLKIEQYLSE